MGVSGKRVRRLAELSGRSTPVTGDPAEFGNIRAFRIPCSKIWTPDIVLYNNADDYTRGYYQSRAMIHANGCVSFDPFLYSQNEKGSTDTCSGRRRHSCGRRARSM